MGGPKKDATGMWLALTLFSTVEYSGPTMGRASEQSDYELSLVKISLNRSTIHVQYMFELELPSYDDLILSFVSSFGMTRLSTLSNNNDTPMNLRTLQS